ncbi:hypothetical protein L596_011330 [Steinernema carpocapsae]|uniref:DUF7747 domain-containing protein n=1 Tax=Steinernema carpocapsae TaxID=34508 RepID=A0A4U5NUF3_STECR|nr:hypothetical protein L596_011330 [Steinernema carpocapsae]
MRDHAEEEIDIIHFDSPAEVDVAGNQLQFVPQLHPDDPVQKAKQEQGNAAEEPATSATRGSRKRKGLFDTSDLQKLIASRKKKETNKSNSDHADENGAVIYSHDLPANCDDALRMILNLGNCIDKRLLSTRRPFMPPSCEETGDFVFVLDMGNGANAELARKDLNFDGLSPWNTKGSARMASKVLYYKVEESEYVKVSSADQANVLLRKIYGVLPRCNRISKRLFYAEDISTNHIIGYVVICYSYVAPGPMPDRIVPRGYGAAQERMSRLKAGSDDCDPGIDLSNILPPNESYATRSPDGQPVYSNTIPTVSDVILPLIFNINNVVDLNRVCSQMPFLSPDCTGIGDFLFVVNPSALKKYRYVTIDGLIPWNSRDQKMCNRQFYYDVEEGPDGQPTKFTRKLAKQGSNLLFRKICGSLPRDSRLTKRIFYAISLPRRKLAGFILIAYSFTYPGPMPVQVYENEDHAFSLRRLRAMQDRQQEDSEESDDDDVFIDDNIEESTGDDDQIVMEQGCPIYAQEIPKTSDEAVTLLLDMKKSIDPNLVSKRQPFMPPFFTGIGQFLFVISPAAVKSVKDVTVDGLAPWNSKDRKMASKFIYYRRESEDILVKVSAREDADIVLRKVHGVLPRCPRIVKKIYYALDAKTEETVGYILIGYQYRYRGAMPTPVAHGNSKRPGHAFQRMFPSTLSEMKSLLKENLPAVAMQKAAEKAMTDDTSMQHPCATPNNIHVLYNLAKYVPDRVKRQTMNEMRDKDSSNDLFLRRTKPHQAHTVVRPRQFFRKDMYPPYGRPSDANALVAKLFQGQSGHESDDNDDEIDVVNVQPARRFTEEDEPSGSQGPQPRYSSPGFFPKGGLYRHQLVPARRGIPPDAQAHANRIEWLQNNKTGDYRWLLNASSRTLASSSSALQSAIMSAVEAEVTAEHEDVHFGARPTLPKNEPEGNAPASPLVLPRPNKSFPPGPFLF